MEKPGKFTTLAVLTLVSGVSNIIGGLLLTVMVVIGTFGLGLLCAPLTLLPTVLGVFELIYAIKMLSDPPRISQPAPVIAGLEIACLLYGNIIAAAAGIVALVMYNDEEIKAYLASLSPN
jgi:hypothetical protein